jgi:hypothetical protein
MDNSSRILALIEDIHKTQKLMNCLVNMNGQKKVENGTKGNIKE